MTISWHVLDGDSGDMSGLAADGHLLGTLTVGSQELSQKGANSAVLSIDLNVLGARNATCAVTTQLRSSLPVSEPRVSSFLDGGSTLTLAETPDHLFGVLEFDAKLDIQAATCAAYKALFGNCLAAEKPHLLRLWNFVPRITALENGQERYRLFNVGRHEAFTETGYLSQLGAPAACALGTHRGNVKIAFLAASRPAVSIENSRQISAYHYPKDYGFRPPVFSRAAWFAQPPGSDILFLSGTASIVGHQSLHDGDVAAQTHETLKNIHTVLQEANKKAGRDVWSLRDLHGQVFVRNPADLPIIQGILQSEGLLHLTYLHADICRAELLVEIEAYAQV